MLPEIMRRQEVDTKLYDTKDSPEEPAWATPWTLIHFSTGFLAHAAWKALAPRMAFGPAFITWSLLHALYELKDMTYTWLGKFEGKYADHSFQNTVGDQVAAMLGFLIASQSSAGHWSTAPVIAVAVAYILVAHPANDAQGATWALHPRDLWLHRG
jgi:hypothetical protein